MPKMDMVDLRSQYAKISEEIDASVLEVVRSTAYINGPQVKAFQQNLEEYLDVKHVVPCANGTDALQIAVMALGLQPGDEVVTTSFTYVATVEVLLLLGLTPILVDVDERTFNMDPDSLEASITSKTRAIVPVHLFGQGANMERIMAIAKKHNLQVVEDTAQALGATITYQGQKRALGTIGDFGTTSFFPSKNLGCYGDGGALFTNDDQLAGLARKIANHGQTKRYYHSHVGVNSRLDSIQAAVLNVKLKHLDEYNSARQKAADRYDKAFGSLKEVKTPQRDENGEHIFHQYTLRVPSEKRTAFQKHLEAAEIATTIYYPVAAHEQEAYQGKVKVSSLTVTQRITPEVVSLPIHTELNEENQGYIIDAVLSFFK